MSDVSKQKPQNRWTKAIFFLLLFLCIIVGGGLLKIMQSFFKPVVLSVLLSLVFFPIVKKLKEKWHIPFWLGITLVYVLFFGIFFGIGNILTASFKAILGSLPDYEEKFRAIFGAISEALAKRHDNPLVGFLNFNDELSFSENIIEALDIQGVLKSAALGAGGTFIAFVKSLFLVSILSIFLLAEMNSTEKK